MAKFGRGRYFGIAYLTGIFEILAKTLLELNMHFKIPVIFLVRIRVHTCKL